MSLRTPINDFFPTTQDAGVGPVSRRDGEGIIDHADAATQAAGGGEYLGLTVQPKTVRLALAATLTVLGLLLGRAAQVQVIRGDVYRSQAEGNRVRIVRLAAERGVMYDRNGTPLLRNVPAFFAAVTPADLPRTVSERRAIIGRLAEIIDADPDEIEKSIAEFRGSSSAIPVGRELPHAKAIELKIDSLGLPGISLEVALRRDYLASKTTPSLSHLLGYMGKVTKEDLASNDGIEYLPSDAVGRIGLERQYEATLRGRAGIKRIEVDAVGKEKAVIAEEGGVRGANLVLTVSRDLQEKAESALKAGLAKFGKTRGSVIVMSPRTGDVLAMVSEPDFDNNLFARGISSDDYRRLADNPSNPLFPRAIAGLLPPGSTFKLAVAADALEEKVATAATTIMSVGGLYVGIWYFPDWKAGGHGATDVTKAIAESVNTFFYIVGGGHEKTEGLGIDRIVSYARRFGMGSRLGIDLPGESDGFLPSIEWKNKVKGEPWYIGDTYHAAIGQGDILVTPLQIAAETAVIANRGVLVKPRIVAAVTTADGRRDVRDPEVLNDRVVSPESAALVAKGMRRGVTDGSGRGLADLPVPVAAKTGTAQWHSTKAPHAWFTSFAPYDKPEITVTVVVEEGEEGSRIGAQVAREIYAWYFDPQRRTK
ncbi:penicillin-binding protein 2 [Candidatus Uhrbacteria bacterium]|nr:penicillin-binding protein 2 [Candidatus Uhrbacteria bacterium]